MPVCVQTDSGAAGRLFDGPLPPELTLAPEKQPPPDFMRGVFLAAGTGRS
jgi:hypothetical protein